MWTKGYFIAQGARAPFHDKQKGKTDSKGTLHYGSEQLEYGTSDLDLTLTHEWVGERSEARERGK